MSKEEKSSFVKSGAAFRRFRNNHAEDPKVDDVFVAFVHGEFQDIGSDEAVLIEAMNRRFGDVPMYVGPVKERTEHLHTPQSGHRGGGRAMSDEPTFGSQELPARTGAEKGRVRPGAYGPESFETSMAAFKRFKANHLDDPAVNDVFVAFVHGEFQDVGSDRAALVMDMYDRFGNVPMCVDSVNGSGRVAHVRTPRFVRKHAEGGV